MPEIFGKIPWKHHVHIFSKCHTIDEALFYIKMVVEEGWSRSRLEDQIAANLYAKKGTAITNFDNTLPAPQSMLAKEMLKDPYNFDFLTIGKKYEEKDLEDALVDNVTQFLLELGKGFHTSVAKWSCRCQEGRLSFPICCFITFLSTAML